MIFYATNFLLPYVISFKGLLHQVCCMYLHARWETWGRELGGVVMKLCDCVSELMLVARVPISHTRFIVK